MGFRLKQGQLKEQWTINQTVDGFEKLDGEEHDVEVVDTNETARLLAEVSPNVGRGTEPNFSGLTMLVSESHGLADDVLELKSLKEGGGDVNAFYVEAMLNRL